MNTNTNENFHIIFELYRTSRHLLRAPQKIGIAKYPVSKLLDEKPLDIW